MKALQSLISRAFGFSILVFVGILEKVNFNNFGFLGHLVHYFHLIGCDLYSICYPSKKKKICIPSVAY